MGRCRSIRPSALSWTGARQQLIALGVAQFLPAHQVVGRAAASQELHEHQGLVDVAHAHAPRDVVLQALVGGGGGWGHGGSWGWPGPPRAVTPS